MSTDDSTGASEAREPAPAGPRRSTSVYALATYGTNVAVAMLGLVNVLIVSRTLGPVGRGEVAFLMTMASLIALVAGFGIQTANAYYGGSAAHLRGTLAANSLVLAVAFGALGIGVVTLLVRFVPAAGGHIGAETRWIALASVPIMILGTYLTVLVQADYRFGMANATWLLSPIVNVITNGTLAGLGILSVRSAITTWVAAQALGAAILIWYAARRFSGFSPPNLALVRRMVGFGLKTHAGQIGMVGNYRLDQWLLGSISGARPLGLYSVAVAWSEVLFFLPSAIVSAQRPDLVRSDREQAGRLAVRAFRLTFVVTFVLGLLMIVAAPFLCSTIFGPAFGGSVRDLRILALGGLGVAATKQLGNALTTQGRPLLETLGIVAAFLVTAVADVLLIPPNADLGASIASTISYCAGGLVMAAIFARSFNRSLWELFPRWDDLRWLQKKLRDRLGTPVAKES